MNRPTGASELAAIDRAARMSMTRRWVLGAAAFAAASTIAPPLPARAQTEPAAEPMGKPGELRWLDGHAGMLGSTVGVPWVMGALKKDQPVALVDAGGKTVVSESWPLAYWADGSVKWTAHALPLNQAMNAESFTLKVGAPGETGQIKVEEGAEGITVSTGAGEWVIARSGEVLVKSAKTGAGTVLENGRLVCLIQDGPGMEDAGSVKREKLVSRVEKASVEQKGTARAVVKVEGVHASESGRPKAPFVVRLYFYSGSAQARVVHSIVYDLDETKEFVAGIGVQFEVPMKDAAYDRHVRFVGEGDGHTNGVWAEAIQGITGLRRDPGRAVREAQIAGKKLPEMSQWAAPVPALLKYVPQWGDYSLRQLSADGFDIRKRTKPGHGWIASAASKRSAGTGYVGGVSGGVAFGMRDFWQKPPAQLDIRGANTDRATVTLWLWSPEAAPMDLRFYHDGLGEDSYPKQLDALNITYEDYEPGFGSPHGVARTSEMILWPVETTPGNAELAAFAGSVQKPPQLAASPETYLQAKVFGALWSPVDRSTPLKAEMEDRLAMLIDHYRKEVEQRHWYGFWDYGDVMHTYDADRHVWRYDVGGFAWDNSELSPDLWLWYSFLRTGKAETFRFAESMTRHTGEVDVYHLGRFKGLGSRHNVMHWGCSAKQLRISTVVYRRFYYYLTADERVGDLMRDLVNCDETFMELDPIRKIRVGAYTQEPHALAVGLGTDWGSIASALLTEWERTGDEKIKAKLVESMTSIAALPHGFYSSGSARYDPATGHFSAADDKAGVSHLNAVFGLPEMAMELMQNFPNAAFEKAWMDYCEYYNASREERKAALGIDFKSEPLTQAHSRLTAQAAVRLGKPELAKRAWGEFMRDAGAMGAVRPIQVVKVSPPAVLKPIEEAPRVSTNDTAQWSLTAMQLLALVGNAAPERENG